VQAVSGVNNHQRVEVNGANSLLHLLHHMPRCCTVLLTCNAVGLCRLRLV
jgi:hypothetical protein